jgi:rubrerythrin
MQEQFTVRKSLELAVVTEEMGARLYTQLAGKFAHDRELASLFEQLALEEQDHHWQFESLLELAPIGDEGQIDAEGVSRLQKLAAFQYFSPKSGPFVGVDEIESEEEGLAHALTFEEATLELYLVLRDLLGPSVPLDALVHTERDHVARIQDVIAALRILPAALPRRPAKPQGAKSNNGAVEPSR